MTAYDPDSTWHKSGLSRGFSFGGLKDTRESGEGKATNTFALLGLYLVTVSMS